MHHPNPPSSVGPKPPPPPPKRSASTVDWKAANPWAPICFSPIPLGLANDCLEQWGHRMGPLRRGKSGALGCHALFDDGLPVLVVIVSSLIRETVAASNGLLTRRNTVELSRLCAARPGLCRVGLRLWREFVFPKLGYAYAVSYQDADLHTGATYRFDGWKVLGNSRSGTDTRSGRKGRRKRIWIWPGLPEGLIITPSPGIP